MLDITPVEVDISIALYTILYSGRIKSDLRLWIISTLSFSTVIHLNYCHHEDGLLYRMSLEVRTPTGNPCTQYLQCGCPLNHKSAVTNLSLPSHPRPCYANASDTSNLPFLIQPNSAVQSNKRQYSTLSMQNLRSSSSYHDLVVVVESHDLEHYISCLSTLCPGR